MRALSVVARTVRKVAWLVVGLPMSIVWTVTRSVAGGIGGISSVFAGILAVAIAGPIVTLTLALVFAFLLVLIPTVLAIVGLAVIVALVAWPFVRRAQIRRWKEELRRWEEELERWR
ncbi:hypothetical protein H5T56_05410 [Candidatus Bipolaricaulota bacterium]|nr:hypothetical protein [Candidatus Bipolaricaulota bacterium]